MDSVWNEILAVFLLIVFNGILAMSEAAMLSVRKARLQQRINEGDRRARLALKLAESPNKFLSTIQIGITVIDVLIGAISGALAAELFIGWLAKSPPLAPFSEAIGVAIGVVITALFFHRAGRTDPQAAGLAES